ncbi:MAG: LPXTG cell wall anchor domain-containing protein [Lachnospiraceae bacterium]|nr:LPXTG cell wall anchor domain-containing protein [Lachnospiraceae bacterium]
MRKKLLSLLAIGMSAIMSIAALGANSPSGVQIVEHNLGDDYKLTVSTDHDSDYYSTDAGKESKTWIEFLEKNGNLKDLLANVNVHSNVPAGTDLERLVLVDGSAYDIVVKKDGEVVAWDQPAQIVVNFPMMVPGNDYFVLWGDAKDGIWIASVEGTVGGSAQSLNGAVLADMTAPTVSGQNVTIDYNSLTGGFFALLYKTTSGGTGDVNPVVPVLAGIVVVSAAVIIFRRKRA